MADGLSHAGAGGQVEIMMALEEKFDLQLDEEGAASPSPAPDPPPSPPPLLSTPCPCAPLGTLFFPWASEHH